jgi:hypothetical protein
LCNVIHKVITKTIVNRLKVHLPNIVKPLSDRSNRKPDLHPVRLMLKNSLRENRQKTAKTGKNRGKTGRVERSGGSDFFFFFFSFFQYDFYFFWEKF